MVRENERLVLDILSFYLSNRIEAYVNYTLARAQQLGLGNPATQTREADKQESKLRQKFGPGKGGGSGCHVYVYVW